MLAHHHLVYMIEQYLYFDLKTTVQLLRPAALDSSSSTLTWS
jgi:hypothetical protein